MKSEFYGTEIFLDNEATREYLDICRNALKRGDPGEYYEIHQVIPSGYWHLLPGSQKGRLPEAMPKVKRVSCMLLPEEHYRCHELIVLMFPEGSKDRFHAMWDLQRRKAKSSAEYADKQRQFNSDKDWQARKEHLKYEGM